jgi:hypothetical protein
MARRRATIACDLPLKRAVDGSDRSKPEGGPARVDAKKNEAEMTCIHYQPGLLAFVVLFLYLPRRARCPACTSFSQALLRERRLQRR